MERLNFVRKNGDVKCPWSVGEWTQENRFRFWHHTDGTGSVNRKNRSIDRMGARIAQYGRIRDLLCGYGDGAGLDISLLLRKQRKA